MDLTELPITTTEVIPEDYLDVMGHMNVMWYTHLFSRATGGLFELFGIDYAYYSSGRGGTFALEAHIRYLAEVRVGQKVIIRSRALARSNKRFHFMHFLVNDDKGVLSATGEFVGAHVDLNIRRMSPFPADISERLDQLCAQHAKISWPAPVCGVMRV